MNPQGPSPTPPEQPAIHNPLSVMQPGEQVICEIKRHPVGILGIYTATGILIIFLAVLAFVVAPNLSSDHRSQVTAIGGLVFLVLTLLSIGFTFISNKVYWGNRWIVTSDSVTQVTQSSLFDRQSSQLSLGNLEDVTASQDGIFPHMFGYGRLRVETAGERSKFTFPFCPNPNYYAQQILNAREQFEQRRGGESGNPQRPYRSEGTYAADPSGNPNPDPGVNVNTEQ
jgi:uncharacterized membrane protein YdbT with pleckstrin-like domain